MLNSKAYYGADSILTPRCCPLRTASTSPVAMKCLVIPKVVPKIGTTQDVTMPILKPDGLRIHFIPSNWISSLGKPRILSNHVVSCHRRWLLRKAMQSQNGAAQGQFQQVFTPGSI